jgi:hypothetical protein
MSDEMTKDDRAGADLTVQQPKRSVVIELNVEMSDDGRSPTIIYGNAARISDASDVKQAENATAIDDRHEYLRPRVEVVAKDGQTSRIATLTRIFDEAEKEHTISLALTENCACACGQTACAGGGAGGMS